MCLVKIYLHAGMHIYAVKQQTNRKKESHVHVPDICLDIPSTAIMKLLEMNSETTLPSGRSRSRGRIIISFTTANYKNTHVHDPDCMCAKFK